MPTHLSDMFLAAGSLVTLLACSSCASLHGAWYYQTYEIRNTDVGEKLYLAIVNDTKNAIVVNEVSVNEVERQKYVGWSCRLDRTIARGELLVLWLPGTGGAQCAVPVRARLKTDKGKWMDIELSGAMPSALPDYWKACPNFPAPGKPPGDNSPTRDGAGTVGESLQLKCDPKP